MEHLLQNPVYNALLSGDAHLGFGTGVVRCFHEEVSPFVGFPEGYDNGFEDLYHLLRPGRKILYAIPESILEPDGWQLVVAVNGLHFIYDKGPVDMTSNLDLVPLQKEHVKEMVELATLTKPGPFDVRTIEFGHYHGIFDSGHLVAMTGQRLHVGEYTEISAVCTHPDYLGRGFAAALTQHQLNFIYSQGKLPFLHVRADNDRAIALYKRLGFEVSREMNFYFMKRR